MSNLSKKVQNFAHANNIFWEGQKILIGVSGGADSVCLLHILLELAKKYRFSLQIAHVNYNLRGKDSAKDQELVKKIAKANDISLSVLKIEKPEKVSNLENELREIRYEFFESERRKLKFDCIAVAHNQDDQAETVLFRILRGSGLQGVAAMKAKNGKVIRPLLGVSRKEILDYMRKNKIKFRLDKTNLLAVFARNKIRLGLIPYLEKNYNISIKRNLANLAEISADAYEYISREAEKKFVLKYGENGGVEFSASKATRLNQAIFREGLRRAVCCVKSDLEDIDLGHIVEFEKLVRSPKNKISKMAFRGLKVEKRGDIVVIMRSK